MKISRRDAFSYLGKLTLLYNCPPLFIEQQPLPDYTLDRINYYKNRQFRNINFSCDKDTVFKVCSFDGCRIIKTNKCSLKIYNSKITVTKPILATEKQKSIYDRDYNNWSICLDSENGDVLHTCYIIYKE